MIGLAESQNLVESNAAFLIFRTKNNRLLIDESAVYKSRAKSLLQKGKVARIDLPGAPDIERAYIDGIDKFIKKIEMDHTIAMEFRAELMAPFREDPCGGRLLFPFSKDLRTVGGHEF
jgi:hypothetical protein